MTGNFRPARPNGQAESCQAQLPHLRLSPKCHHVHRGHGGQGWIPGTSVCNQPRGWEPAFSPQKFLGSRAAQSHLCPARPPRRPAAPCCGLWGGVHGFTESVVGGELADLFKSLKCHHNPFLVAVDRQQPGRQLLPGKDEKVIPVAWGCHAAHGRRRPRQACQEPRPASPRLPGQTATSRSEHGLWAVPTAMPASPAPSGPWADGHLERQQPRLDAPAAAQT